MTLTQKQTDFVAKAPVSAQGIMVKAFRAQASPRAAIKAKCLDCCHFDRSEVANCAVELCPIHAYRPFQPKNARPERKNGSALDH